MRVYFGTYSQRGSQGIYLYDFNADTGVLTNSGLRGAAENPSFVALRPDGRVLYAVEELGQFAGQNGGGLAAFAVNPTTGALRPIGAQPTHGAAPCHVAIDPTGKAAVVANYSGGSATVFALANDGAPLPSPQVIQHQGHGANPARQEAPHVHSSAFNPSGRRVYVCDLGLDKVFCYRLDLGALRLVDNDPPTTSTHPGAGPRHFAFHPNHPFAYLANEVDSTTTAFAYDALTGSLTEIEHQSTLPAGWSEPNTAADIHVHPSGKWLYVSNRGQDSLVVYAIDAQTGRLTPQQWIASGGRTPRGFAVDPSGQWLLCANQDGDNATVFHIDLETGRLAEGAASIAIPAPVCVVFASTKKE